MYLQPHAAIRKGFFCIGYYLSSHYASLEITTPRYMPAAKPIAVMVYKPEVIGHAMMCTHAKIQLDSSLGGPALIDLLGL